MDLKQKNKISEFRLFKRARDEAIEYYTKDMPAELRKKLWVHIRYGMNFGYNYSKKEKKNGESSSK